MNENLSNLKCGALAIFVKTPGLSPIKTRLSASLGISNAHRFYHLALTAVIAMIQKIKSEIPHIQIYFAVSEKEGLSSPLWSDFPTLWQGPGNSLGEKLSFVYDKILEKHSFACFMGADSPHLSFMQIYKAILVTEAFKDTNFVLGETEDGGFYFFGGGLPILNSHWLKINYSCSTTSAELKAEFKRIASIRQLQESFDIDTVEDLKKYQQESFPMFNLLNEQLEIIHWARTIT